MSDESKTKKWMLQEQKSISRTMDRKAVFFFF